MTEQHPITPPPELVQQWMNEIYDDLNGVDQFVSSDDRALAARAVQWGADTELEACCEWFTSKFGAEVKADIADLRAARRPKPQSLKEQSLALIDKIQASREPWLVEELDIVRKALEALPDD